MFRSNVAASDSDLVVIIIASVGVKPSEHFTASCSFSDQNYLGHVM